MTQHPPAAAARLETARAVTDRLNRDCFCVTLDREALCRALAAEAGDARFCDTYLDARPHLFSSAPVFLARADLARMLATAQAIEAAAALPGYREAALAWAPPVARPDFGPAGAFMGYDFHLAGDVPQLIEVNTNAGGAFLNALLARAQRACCDVVEAALAPSLLDGFEPAVAAMFREEWRRQRGAAPLRSIAIVDDDPAAQYLYPEFLLAQRLLQRHGLEAVIADPAQLRHAGGRLTVDGRPVDLVYNRLVDFALDLPAHAALRAAYLAGDVVVTPNPRVHALLADKRNLTLLSDGARLEAWGLPAAQRAALAGVPRTELLTPACADDVWARRKRLFFKPATGYGSKAVYRGDKITRAVWTQITRDAYVAQAFAPPGERRVEIDGTMHPRKVDVRLYTYAGNLLLVAARLYQGQATNFRTPGGGFAPVFPI